MAKYYVRWWERNWWEVTVEAKDEEDAKAIVDEFGDDIRARCYETNFIDKGDLIVEKCLEDYYDDPMMPEAEKDIKQFDKAFPPDKE